MLDFNFTFTRFLHFDILPFQDLLHHIHTFTITWTSLRFTNSNNSTSIDRIAKNVDQFRTQTTSPSNIWHTISSGSRTIVSIPNGIKSGENYWSDGDSAEDILYNSMCLTT
jgi:hypothetical protein